MRATLCLALAAVTLAASAQAQTGDNLIVPGSRIGPVSIGMTLNEALKRAGPTVRSIFGPNDPTSGQIEFASRISIGVKGREQRVVSVCARHPSKFSTREGIRPGMSEVEIRSRLGPPNRRLGDTPPTVWLEYPGLTFTTIDGQAFIHICTSAR